MAIARKRSEMTIGAQKALGELDNILADILEVKTESIPRLQDRRADSTSFKYILKKMHPKKKKVDNRAQHCIFQKKELVNCTEERLLALMTMEEQANNKEELRHEPNEVELYKKECEFVLKLIEWGCLGKEDFDIEE